MTGQKSVNSGRVFFGALGFAAIITQLVIGIEQQRSIANFFSFFTIESNILAAVLLMVIGVYGLAGKSGKQIGYLRGAITLYMVMTGIIYALLLSGLEASLQTTTPWVNIVLHYIMPAVVLIDWLVFPPTQRLSFRVSLLWLIYPLAYLAYSLARGAFVQWYPYPFINPIVNGWPNVIGASLAIGLGVVVLAWLLALRTAGKQKPNDA